jgi:hypothetical protein
LGIKLRCSGKKQNKKVRYQTNPKEEEEDVEEEEEEDEVG